MNVVLVLALIAAALALVSLIRVGVWVAYTPSELTLRLKVGPVRVTLLPRRQKKHPKQNSRETQRPEPVPEKHDVPGMLRRGIPVAAEAAGRLRRKVRLDRVYLDVTAAAADPACAALAFGGVNAAVGMIWPLVEQNFKVGDRRIRTRVDFEADHPSASLDAAATLTVGQALALAVWLVPKLPQVVGTEKQTKQQLDITQKEAV